MAEDASVHVEPRTSAAHGLFLPRWCSSSESSTTACRGRAGPAEEGQLHARLERRELRRLLRALLGRTLVDELPAPEPLRHPLLDALRDGRDLLAGGRARPAWKRTAPSSSRVKTPSGQTTWKCTKEPSAEWNLCTNVTLPVSAPASPEDVFCQRASSVTKKLRVGTPSARRGGAPSHDALRTDATWHAPPRARAGDVASRATGAGGRRRDEPRGSRGGDGSERGGDGGGARARVFASVMRAALGRRSATAASSPKTVDFGVAFFGPGARVMPTSYHPSRTLAEDFGASSRPRLPLAMPSRRRAGVRRQDGSSRTWRTGRRPLKREVATRKRLN